MVVNSTAAIFFLLIVIGGICLQIFLSRKENKWFGLILPFIFLAYSVVMMLSILVYESMTAWEIFSLILSTFFIANIPTGVLLAIYFGCREKFKRRRELDKMKAQDLNDGAEG
jgi:hypothetical protein